MTTIKHPSSHRALIAKLGSMRERIDMGELDSPGGACCPESVIALLTEAEQVLKAQEREVKSLRLQLRKKSS